MTCNHPDMAAIGPECRLFPPWGAPHQWREANAALNRLVAIHAGRLNPSVAIARSVSDRLKSLFPLLDLLCAETCPHCPEPCCLDARIWVDFKDLLFLHLSGYPVPRTQLIAHPRSQCICVGHGGCALPRLSRPWVCTWYLCPAQTARLRRRPESDQALFRDGVHAIKALRSRMEDAFIEATVR